MQLFPNSSPLFGLMALLRSMCSKTCRAAEATSTVAAFPPGAQDVLVSIVGKMFLLLSHNFFGLFVLQGSYGHYCSDTLLSFAIYISEVIIVVGVSRW